MTRQLNEAFAALAAAQHGVVTRRQAAAARLTRYRLAVLVRDGLLDEPVPGVLRVRAAVPTWHQRLSVAVLAAGMRWRPTDRRPASTGSTACASIWWWRCRCRDRDATGYGVWSRITSPRSTRPT